MIFIDPIFGLFISQRQKSGQNHHIGPFSSWHYPPLSKLSGLQQPKRHRQDLPTVDSFHADRTRFSFQGVFFTIKTYSSYIQCCFWRSSRKVKKNSLDTKCPPIFWVMTSFISFLLGGVESFNVNNKNYWNHHLVYKDWLPHMIL